MNEQRFDAKGSSYSKSRPLYPQELIQWLTASEIITGASDVADIGSGTGIFSMQIQPFVRRVYAVEPNESMRSRAEAAFKQYGNILSINASAEQTTLEPHSIDCITAAQSFHWFDPSAFQRECQRILKPGGTIVLIWNERDMAAEIIRKNSEINARYCPDYHGFSNGMVFGDLESSRFYRGGCRLTRFENPVEYDLETFIQRNLSSSFAPRADHPEYLPYIRALTDLFHGFSSDGRIAYPYTTRCYTGTV